jgi:hypothetical protein
MCTSRLLTNPHTEVIDWRNVAGCAYDQIVDLAIESVITKSTITAANVRLGLAYSGFFSWK